MSYDAPLKTRQIHYHTHLSSLASLLLRKAQITTQQHSVPHKRSSSRVCSEHLALCTPHTALWARSRISMLLSEHLNTSALRHEGSLWHAAAHAQQRAGL